LAIIKHDWHGLYKESWGKTIVPQAYSHPAKFRPALIRQIYAHLLAQGYIKAGDTIVDSFAGVALGALHAMQNGLIWVGVELEARFVDLGQQNIDLWNRKYSTMPGWGQAAILQGDSRHLCEVLGRGGVAGASVSSSPFPDGGVGDNRFGGGLRDKSIIARRKVGGGGLTAYGTTQGQLASLPEGDAPQVPVLRVPQAGAVVSSPPYASGCQHTGGDDPHPEHVQGDTYYGVGIAGAISSPPYTASLASDDPDKRGGLFRDPRRRGDRNMTGEYGASEGQIGAMREGEPPSAVVSSPPYIGSVNQSTQANDARARVDRKAQAGVDVSKAVNVGGPNSVLNQPQVYGVTPGQLGAMAEGQPVQASVSSPPWEGTGVGGKENVVSLNRQCVSHNRPDYVGKGQEAHNLTYGETGGQLGTESGTTFWEASAEIMRQVYQVLAPGAVAVWVCKSFIRAGQVVPFPEQWAALGEACGFETIKWIRCWLVEDRGAQYTLNGDLSLLQAAYKSFFRRLSEKRGSPEINFEVVLIQRKPDALPGAQETEPGAEADTLEVLPLFAEVVS